ASQANHRPTRPPAPDDLTAIWDAVTSLLPGGDPRATAGGEDRLRLPKGSGDGRETSIGGRGRVLRSADGHLSRGGLTGAMRARSRCHAKCPPDRPCCCAPALVECRELSTMCRNNRRAGRVP